MADRQIKNRVDEHIERQTGRQTYRVGQYMDGNMDRRKTKCFTNRQADTKRQTWMEIRTDGKNVSHIDRQTNRQILLEIWKDGKQVHT
jgi:hypothetical protein